MIRGLYTAASGMLATTIATDTLANNLANVSTVGYKNSKVNYQGFPEMLISRISSQGQTPIGSLMSGSTIRQTAVDFAPGTLRETGNPLDLALEGDAFFTVKDARSGDVYYTRAGNFTVNQQGYLSTLNGDLVQGDNGDIPIRLDDGNISINTRGRIATRGGVVDQLKIVRFANPNLLEKVGDTKFRTLPVAGAPVSAEGTGYTVHQGRLEQSNTNPISELVNNIQGMRLYEALQKNIHLSNETLQKAVNDVGRYK